MTTPAKAVWFVTGSQNLYGEETLKQVAADSRTIARHFDETAAIPARVIWKPTLKAPDEIGRLMREASADDTCVGLICWMHTFSPAKMWINGLNALRKPWMHLHTQFNRDLPWDAIDMDFMNLNQSAHGGREFGFVGTRLGLNRKVVVGHWQDAGVQARIAAWTRAALGYAEAATLKVARLGDNMREVAVTEGNKVSAQAVFGYAVNGYGIGDLRVFLDQVTDAQVGRLVSEYKEQYRLPGDDEHAMAQIREAARLEIGLRAFLEDGGFGAFTTTFENLNGLDQLPGLASQRLMADGYGFGAEGDWKTAALTRIMKVMAAGLDGGTTFMEDYTYHLEPGNTKVLGAHMLEICPSIAAGDVSLEVHPLGIGGKSDPARLVFDGATGPALNATLIDLGSRFRLIVNTVDAVAPDGDLAKLPTARTVWVPRPDLATGAAAWILAGGAHHTVYTQALTVEHLDDVAEMFDIECVVIDEATTVRDFKQTLRYNDVYYHLNRGFRG